MDILVEVFSTKDILEYVVKKAIENYSSKKECFEVQTGGREFWKGDDVCKFMAILGVKLEEKHVN